MQVACTCSSMHTAYLRYTCGMRHTDIEDSSAVFVRNMQQTCNKHATNMQQTSQFYMQDTAYLQRICNMPHIDPDDGSMQQCNTQHAHDKHAAYFRHTRSMPVTYVMQHAYAPCSMLARRVWCRPYDRLTSNPRNLGLIYSSDTSTSGWHGCQHATCDVHRYSRRVGCWRRR